MWSVGLQYPCGVFLDSAQKELASELASVLAQGKLFGQVKVPAGPDTGFHIFLSYRRKNASDARSLKQVCVPTLCSNKRWHTTVV